MLQTSVNADFRTSGKVVTFGRPRKWLFLLVDICDLSGNHHSFKVLYSLSAGLPDHMKFFQGHFVFQRDRVGFFHTFMGVRRRGETDICPPGNWTKNQKFLENLKSAFDSDYLI